MAEPTITFGFKHTGLDTAWSYNGSGDPEINGWKTINPTVDVICFTGGGILGSIPTPTCASGTRDATIRPSAAPYVIPQTFVEKPDLMYIANNCGKNANIYAMGVYVDGYMSSDLYLEAFDDNSFSTTALEVLAGTTNTSFMSFINARRTTDLVLPEADWDGSSDGAVYLRGTEHRIGLMNESSITDATVYYNIYIELPTDCSTFHVTPCICFRYLYT